MINRSDSFQENLKLCFGEVPKESVKLSGPLEPSIPPESGSSEDVVLDEDPVSLSVPESSFALESPSPRSGSVDESLVNYNSYRHKLIEETLQKEYGGGYAPGNVILNLIELNTVNSSSDVILDKKYDVSYFDLVNVEVVCNVVEYPDQLDHFIPRNPKKRSKTEIHTEISEVNVTPSTRPNTPTSCQRMTVKRSKEAGGLLKTPSLTPVQSQSPMNAEESTANEIRLLGPPPPTEQLYKRKDDAGPDVVSKTHVEAEAEYLNGIAKNRRCETKMKLVRSSMKKSRQRVCGEGASYDRNGRRILSDNNTGDCNTLRRSPIRNLTVLKPTVWNNSGN